jgi:hypothetical protein
MCACANPECGCKAAEPEAAAKHPATPTVEHLYHALYHMEQRLVALEADRDRFLAALKGAAGMCLKNPMVAGMLPKQMRDDLKKYVE